MKGEAETPSNEVENADMPATEIAPYTDLPSPAEIGGPEEGTFLNLDRFPYDSIVSDAPPKDGILALTDRVFVGSSFVEYLRSDNLVMGVMTNSAAGPIRTTWVGGTRSSTTRSATRPYR